MNIFDILVSAKDLIADSNNWTQRVRAVDASNEPCNPWDEGAVKFCAIGAVHRVVIGKGLGARSSKAHLQLINSSVLLLIKAAQLNGKTVGEVNDSLGHEAVMKMFTGAIQLSKEEIVTTLIDARKLIEDKSNWCRHRMGSDKAGYAQKPYSNKAEQFCAIGAIYRVITVRFSGSPFLYPMWALPISGSGLFDKCLGLLDRAAGEHRFGGTINQSNDNLGHEVLLQFYDRAVEIIKES